MIKLVIFTVVINGNTIKHKHNYQDDGENPTRTEPELCCIVEHFWTFQNSYYHYMCIVVMCVYSWIQYAGCSTRIQEIRNSVLAKNWSLNAGKVTACRSLAVVTWFQIFHLRSTFPHLFSKSHHPGKFPVPRVMTGMQKRGQRHNADFSPNTGLAPSAFSCVPVTHNFSLAFLEMF